MRNLLNLIVQIVAEPQSGDVKRVKSFQENINALNVTLLDHKTIIYIIGEELLGR